MLLANLSNAVNSRANMSSKLICSELTFIVFDMFQRAGGGVTVYMCSWSSRSEVGVTLSKCLKYNIFDLNSFSLARATLNIAVTVLRCGPF